VVFRKELLTEEQAEEKFLNTWVSEKDKLIADK